MIIPAVHIAIKVPRSFAFIAFFSIFLIKRCILGTYTDGKNHQEHKTKNIFHMKSLINLIVITEVL